MTKTSSNTVSKSIRRPRWRMLKKMNQCGKWAKIGRMPAGCGQRAALNDNLNKMVSSLNKNYFEYGSLF